MPREHIKTSIQTKSMPPDPILFIQEGSNMAEDWRWHLELQALPSGSYRANIKCYTDSRPKPRGATLKFKVGQRLWEWIEHRWEEVTLEPLLPGDGFSIADKLADLDKVVGHQMKEAILESRVRTAMDEYESLPDSPSLGALILQKATWLDPLPRGAGGMLQGMRRGTCMAAVARFIENHLSRGEAVPTGDLYIEMEGGPEGSGKEFVTPNYQRSFTTVAGRFRIETDAMASAMQKLHKDDPRGYTTFVGVSADGGAWLNGFPAERTFGSQDEALKAYRSLQPRAIRAFVSSIAANVSPQQQAVSVLRMWVYEGQGPNREATPCAGLELQWRADGALWAVSCEGGDESVEGPL